MSKIKIGYIGQRGVPPTYGGVERYVDEIVKRLPREEVETSVYCRGHYVKEKVDYTSQLFVPNLKPGGLEALSHSFCSSLDSLRRPFDILHYQALGPSFFTFLPKLKNTKIVVTVHGLDWDRAKWGGAARFVLKSGDWMVGHCASAIISVSKRLKKYYENKYKKDVFFVPIGFSEPQHLEINEANRKFGLEPFKYILFLNRIVPEKGLHYLFEAFKNIKRDDFKLVVTGILFQGNNYVDSIRKMAKNDSRIILTDYVSRNELHELYSNAYLFALPSELEGMPAVVLEALSHKCPVLVSDIEENLDVIQNKGSIYGFIHKNKDVKDIETQLRFLLDNPDMVDAMRQPGYDFVYREYSWEKAVRMTYDVYKHVLGGRK